MSFIFYFFTTVLGALFSLKPDDDFLWYVEQKITKNHGFYNQKYYIKYYFFVDILSYFIVYFGVQKSIFVTYVIVYF